MMLNKDSNLQSLDNSMDMDINDEDLEIQQNMIKDLLPKKQMLKVVVNLDDYKE